MVSHERVRQRHREKTERNERRERGRMNAADRAHLTIFALMFLCVDNKWRKKVVHELSWINVWIRYWLLPLLHRISTIPDAIAIYIRTRSEENFMEKHRRHFINSNRFCCKSENNNQLATAYQTYLRDTHTAWRRGKQRQEIQFNQAAFQ